MGRFFFVRKFVTQFAKKLALHIATFNLTFGDILLQAIPRAIVAPGAFEMIRWFKWIWPRTPRNLAELTPLGRVVAQNILGAKNYG